MRASCVLVAVILLGGCNREKDFDERYAEAQKAIRDRAVSIDREMTRMESEAALAEPTASPAPAPARETVDPTG